MAKWEERFYNILHFLHCCPTFFFLTFILYWSIVDLPCCTVCFFKEHALNRNVWNVLQFQNQRDSECFLSLFCYEKGQV